MKTIIKTLMLLVFTLNLSAQEMYKNPISLPFDNYGTGDPSTFRWMGKYYLLSSSGDNDRGINIWQSEDMVNWTHSAKIAEADGGIWAPEVIYYEGTFYLYTCHDLGGANFNIKGYKYTPDHASANLPFGPFVKFSDDLVPNQSMDIDPSPFRDDNGDLYMFFSAQTGGIKYVKMDTPESIGSNPVQQLSNCVTNVVTDWTEGPTVHKIDGQYYMTYCGNDVLSPNYTISKARGNSISSLSETANTFINQNTGDWTGTGHNHWILGPDLKTYYTTYHVKRGSGQVSGAALYRRLMLDKIDFDASGNMTTSAPTFNEQPVPELPDWSDDFNRSNIGNEWTFSDGGAWGMDLNYLMWGNSRGQGAPNWWSKAISTQVTNSDFVIEFNVKLWDIGPDEANASPKFGVFISQQTVNSNDEHNIMYIALDVKNKTIGTLISENNTGGWQGDGVSLPNTDFKKWHTIRIKKVGSTVEIFYDNMLKLTKTNVNLGGGHFGFITENSDANFGWVGFSNLN